MGQNKAKNRNKTKPATNRSAPLQGVFQTIHQMEDFMYVAINDFKRLGSENLQIRYALGQLGYSMTKFQLVMTRLLAELEAGRARTEGGMLAADGTRKDLNIDIYAMKTLLDEEYDYIMIFAAFGERMRQEERNRQIEAEMKKAQEQAGEEGEPTDAPAPDEAHGEGEVTQPPVEA